MKKILKLAFIVWVALWAFYTVRELVKSRSQDSLKDYITLASRSLEGKRSYVTGDKFYEFISFCDKKLPARASYKWFGVDDLTLEERRATYYLYPHLKKKGGADFILVYMSAEPESIKRGYELFARLDDSRYILKKR